MMTLPQTQENQKLIFFLIKMTRLFSMFDHEQPLLRLGYVGLLNFIKHSGELLIQRKPLFSIQSPSTCA